MRKRNLSLIVAILLILCFAFISFIGKNTTSAAFQKTSTAEVTVECGSFSDKFIVEIYDGQNLISQEDIELDKEYTMKVYNKSTFSCNYYFTAENSEMNTFSNYLTVIISEPDSVINSNLCGDYAIQTGKRLPKASKLISVSEFKSSDAPMVFNFKISTDTLRSVAQSYPERVTDFNFDLKLNIVAQTVTANE